MKIAMRFLKLNINLLQKMQQLMEDIMNITEAKFYCIVEYSTGEGMRS